MHDEDVALVLHTMERLRAEPNLYAAEVEPHPRAASLVLPDGSPAPPVLRAWAAFDNFYPWYFSCRRSTQRIAKPKGQVIAKPMKTVLRYVCLESIRDELEGDSVTLAYLRELIAQFTGEFPGYGVVLEPEDQPDRVLWMDPGGSATILWYEDDSFEAREPFAEWLSDLFKERGYEQSFA